jgi:sialic acid synthase SpsE
MHQKARRSLIAARAIPRGTRIEADMLTIKRPGFGIKPKYANQVVGRTARVDIEEDAVITWDLL